MSLEFQGSGSASEILLDSDYTCVCDADGSAISFWTYGMSNDNNEDGICGKPAGHYIYARDGSYFGFYDGAGYDEWVADSDFYQKWRHVVLNFWDDAGHKNELFLDSVSQGQKAFVNDLLFNSIGRAYAGSAMDFLGKIMQFACFTKKLAQAQVDLLYCGGILSPMAPLLLPDLDLFFPMMHVTEGVALTGAAADSSGQGRNGTYNANPVGRAEAQISLGAGPMMVITPAAAAGGLPLGALAEQAELHYLDHEYAETFGR